MIFVFRTLRRKEVKKVFKETEEKLSLKDPVKNPFTGGTVFISRPHFYYIVFNLDALYFELKKYLILSYVMVSFFVSILAGRFFFPWWLSVLGGFILLYWFASSPLMFMFTLRLKLNKENYHGPLKLMNNKNFLGVLLFERKKI